MTSPAELRLHSAPEHPGRLELIQYVRGGIAPGHAAAILAHCLVCDPCAVDLATILNEHGYRAVPAGASARATLVLLPRT